MDVWGPLSDRFGTERPRKLLALDGGGIRGVMTLEMLRALERQLAEASGGGEAFRLCDYFDYIGGTSTGAIIAAGLARGLSIEQLRAFYVDAGPAMFDKRFLLNRLKSIYRAQPLADKLHEVFGADTTLAPEHLRCLLMVVTKNVSTDSAWPISSNPLAWYNERSRPDCNLSIPLWKLVRASTAAPVYFPPEVIEWDERDPEKTFVFSDGGVTAYNNPAFLLYRMATQPAYGLKWPEGEGNLLVVSIGTGTAPGEVENALAEGRSVLENVTALPGELLHAMQVDQDVSCRTVGRCTYGDLVDREVGDLIPRDDTGNPIPLHRDLGRSFLYVRYNVSLTASGLAALGLPHVDPDSVSRLDSVDHIDDLVLVGQAASEQVDLAHLGRFAVLTS